VSALAIPFVAFEMLNASTFEIGLLNLVDVLPFLLIGLVAGVWVDWLRRRPILIVGDLGRAVLLAFFGVSAGFSTVIYNVNQVSLRQAIMPARLQGRMNATMRWFVWGTIPLRALLGGVLGGAIGVRETLLVSGILSCFVFLPVLFSPVRRIREMPRPVEEPVLATAATAG
jgi:hypothetical protein